LLPFYAYLFAVRNKYLAGEGSTDSTITADKHRVVRDAQPVPGGVSLRRKLRCVYRAAKERYDGVLEALFD
jgi:hypothetical protein